MFGHGKQGVYDGAVQLKDVLDLPVGGIVVLSHFSGHLYTFLGPELARIPDIMKLHAERTDCRVHLLVRDEHLFMKPVCDLAVCFEFSCQQLEIMMDCSPFSMMRSYSLETISAPIAVSSTSVKPSFFSPSAMS